MTGTEVEVHDVTAGTLAVRSDQVEWSPVQRAALAQIGVADASDADLMVFLHYAQRTQLDPFSRQIYMIKRDGKQTIQTGIDGFRIIAHRTKLYQGRAAVEWCGRDGVWRDVWLGGRANPPHAARVTVLRADFAAPVSAVCVFEEFVARKYSGEINKMWSEKPAHMIAKCFSEDTEVLTEHGYRRFADVGDARIMQVTAGGLEPVVARPFVQDYDGLMITLDSDDLNFSVTPNHDMVTTFGKVEAGALYATSRSRPVWRIPRLVPAAAGPGLAMTDDAIRLAAVIVADGQRSGVPGRSWRVELSRPRKVEILDGLAYLATDRYVRGSRGDEVTSRRSGRVIRSNFDKQGYQFPGEVVEALVDERKRLRPEAVAQMTGKQARALVDTLIEFDGNKIQSTGVRRFYTSNPHTRGMFEVAATIAGYTVNVPRGRTSDLSDRPNWMITISPRDDIPVVRRSDGGTGLEMTPNTAGRVWCVTVPSGVIMVRRNGFGMICGNCAEAAALRTAFPHDLGGLFTDDEMQHLDNPERGPILPNTVDGETSSEPWPDFAAEVAEIERTAKDNPAGAFEALGKVMAKARGLMPNDQATHNAIAEAGRRVQAMMMPPEQEAPKGAKDPKGPKMASGRAKGAIATLMTKGAVTTRIGRLYAAAELAGLEHPLSSFDALEAEAASRVLDTLTAWDKAKPDHEELIAKLDAVLPGDDDPVWEAYDTGEATES